MKYNKKKKKENRFLSRLSVRIGSGFSAGDGLTGTACETSGVIVGSRYAEPREWAQNNWSPEKKIFVLCLTLFVDFFTITDSELRNNRRTQTTAKDVDNYNLYLNRHLISDYCWAFATVLRELDERIH